MSQSGDALPPFRPCHLSALQASYQQFFNIYLLSYFIFLTGRTHRARAGSRSRGLTITFARPPARLPERAASRPGRAV
jgi:energy-converting hydrogenase Eha subunit G